MFTISLCQSSFSRMEENFDSIVQIIVQAGQIALEFLKQPLKVEQKIDETFVSQADIQVNSFIQKELEKINLENVNIVGEEGKKDEKLDYSKGKFIFFDPIDGTNNGWCVMLGYCVDGIPQIGIVYSPTEEKLFYGIKGKGSYLVYKGERTKLQIKDLEPKDCVGCISSKPKKDVQKYLDELEITKYLKKGSMGLKICDIACGEANIYINLDKKSSYWDSCAPCVIIAEAGADPVLNMDTLEPVKFEGNSTLHKYNMVVSTPKLLLKFREYLKK